MTIARFIVLEDADLEKTIELAVKGRMINTGQSCVAAKRFIIVRAIADDFLEGFKEAMSNLKIGDPMDEETTLSPLSTEDAAVNLHKQVQATNPPIRKRNCRVVVLRSRVTDANFTIKTFLNSSTRNSSISDRRKRNDY